MNKSEFSDMIKLIPEDAEIEISGSPTFEIKLSARDGKVKAMFEARRKKRIRKKSAAAPLEVEQ